MAGEIEVNGVENNNLLKPIQNGSSPKPFIQIKMNQNFKELYELEKILGEGRFGKVYKCKERRTKLEFAAKCISIKKDTEKKEVEKEVAIMSKLRHRFITQLYDAFSVSSKEIILVMELVQGGELFLRVIEDDFRMTEQAVALMVYQICEAMDYIHEQNIIHLDLNPQNLMLVFRNSILIKLIDFGLAQYYDASKPLTIMAGTPEFCAPEVVKFEPLSFHTDMWSLGVIVYLLLTGVSPFFDEEEDLIPVLVSKAEWEFIEEFDQVSEQAKDFIARLLVVKKEQRMLPKECLNHPWLDPHKDRFKNIDFLSPPSTPVDGTPLDTQNLKEYVNSRTTFKVMIANKLARVTNTVKNFTRSLSIRKSKRKQKDGASTSKSTENRTPSASISSVKPQNSPRPVKTPKSSPRPSPKPSPKPSITIQTPERTPSTNPSARSARSAGTNSSVTTAELYFTARTQDFHFETSRPCRVQKENCSLTVKPTCSFEIGSRSPSMGSIAGHSNEQNGLDKVFDPMHELEVAIEKIQDAKNFTGIAKKVKPICASSDRVVVELLVDETHINTKGTLHGGMTATLTDIITSRAIGIALQDMTYPRSSLEISVSYLLPVKLGETITIEATVLKTGRNIAFSEAEFRRKSDNSLVAKGKQTMALLKR